MGNVGWGKFRLGKRHFSEWFSLSRTSLNREASASLLATTFVHGNLSE